MNTLLFDRHPREGGDPVLRGESIACWIPAFAGMTNWGDEEHGGLIRSNAADTSIPIIAQRARTRMHSLPRIAARRRPLAQQASANFPAAPRPLRPRALPPASAPDS